MGRRLTDKERAYRAISEKDFQRQITDLAEMYGWEWRHFKDSRKAVVRGGKTFLVGDDDAKGWPDLVLVRPPELVIIEVKKELGKTSPEQDHWLDLLSGCGVDTFVARPSTFDEIRVRLTAPRPKR